jgi:hypothetical protein
VSFRLKVTSGIALTAQCKIVFQLHCITAKAVAPAMNISRSHST